MSALLVCSLLFAEGEDGCRRFSATSRSFYPQTWESSAFFLLLFFKISFIASTWSSYVLVFYGCHRNLPPVSGLNSANVLSYCPLSQKSHVSLTGLKPRNLRAVSLSRGALFLLSWALAEFNSLWYRAEIPVSLLAVSRGPLPAPRGYYIPWLVAPELHLQSHQQKVKCFDSLLFSGSSLWPSWESSCACKDVIRLGTF